MSSVVKNSSLTVPVIAVGVTSLINPQKGEQKTQGGENACLRQLTDATIARCRTRRRRCLITHEQDNSEPRGCSDAPSPGRSAILIWWWFLGLILDRRLARWPLFGMFVVLAALLLWAAAPTPGVFRLRIDYRASHLSTTLLILRFLTPAAWFTLLTSLLVVNVKCVVPSKVTSPLRL